MLLKKKVKIIATLGPATSNTGKIERLFKGGVDIFRLNFSHGDTEFHQQNIDSIREIEKKAGRPIGILMDLQGPKLRVSKFLGDSANLKEGQAFILDQDDALGTNLRVKLPHPEVFSILKPGMNLLIDDGKIRLQVKKISADSITTKVMVGGIISNRKGVNIPDTSLPISALTAEDRKNLEYGLNAGADWIGLSFVQRPEDVEEARQLIQGRAAIMSKIEKPTAITHLNKIIELSDGIMIARGDLGVEMPPEMLPPLQKKIVSACRRAGKPVVVATQMLDSMVSNPTPTRAEASDVATAVYDGADAVMLSAETAVGAYPSTAVKMMARIITRVEKDHQYRTFLDALSLGHNSSSSDAISAAARGVAETVGAVAIVTYTASGSTAIRAARERPNVPIIALVPEATAARRLCVSWGISCILVPEKMDFKGVVEKAKKIALDHKLGEPGQLMVITAGVPFGTPGSTNSLRIAEI